MNSEKFQWIPTNMYLKMLREDAKFVEDDAEKVVGETAYNIGFSQSLKWFQEENGLPCSKKIHCFRLKKEAETEEYLRHVPKEDKAVYLLFEEESRYTYSNSPNLFTEERIKQGIRETDVEEKNDKYLEYLDLLNPSFLV